MTTRREILLHGAIGVGVMASGMSGVSALAAVALPKRRSLAGLAWNDPIVASYRDAVGIMKQKPDSDPFSWVSLAKIHGTDPNTYHFCPHGDWYFLPWHRAYTAMYERVVRKLTSNPGFAMPYWDWTSNPLMPQMFLTPTTPDGKPNWLCVTEQGWTRTWPANKPMPPEIVGPAVLKDILNAQGYENFGTSRNPAQNNLDPSWVPRGGGAQGILEARPHNLVHNNVGGWMPTASSPRDPLFFMHHSNIDRIWALWNVNHTNSTNPLWTKMRFADNFLNVDGSAWSPAVSELYVPEKLGYTYGLSAQQITTPRFVSLNRKMSVLFSVDSAATASAGISTVAVANNKAAASGRPLQVSVNVAPAALSAVRQRPPVSSGLEMLNFPKAQEEAATGTRVLAFLRDVVITDPSATMFRIFVDTDNVSETTPITNPGYVGTFGVFHRGPMGDHAGHGSLPSFALDLTNALQQSPPKADGQITLQIVPVTSDGGSGAAGTATPARFEVSFITS